MGQIVCIDPTSGLTVAQGASPQDTTASAELTPFISWSSVTWARGNRYLQKRGTTFAGKVQPSLTATQASTIFCGAYGSGVRPIVDGEGSGPALFANSKAYITFSSFDVRNCSAAGAISFQTNGAITMQGGRIIGCRASGNVAGDGIAIIDASVTGSIWGDFRIQSCTAAYNYGGGIDLTVRTNGVSIEHCVTHHNGSGANSWGIHVQPVQDKWGTASMVLQGASPSFTYRVPVDANVFEVCVTRASNSLEWRMTAATSASETALGVGEYAVDGGFLFVRSQGSLEGFSNEGVIRATYSGCSGVVIRDCISHTNVTPDGNSDGTGLGFDHFVSNSKIQRCIAYDNSGNGIEFNNVTSCVVEFSFARNNKKYGYSFNLGGGANRIVNCTVASNSAANFFQTRSRTTEGFLNLIVLGAKGMSSDAVSGSASTNAILCFGTSASAGWASMTDSNPNFFQSSAPLLASITPGGSGGTSVAGTRGNPDLYGRYPAGHIPKGCAYFIAAGPTTRYGV